MPSLAELMIRGVQRKRAIGRFRRAHGEAVLELVTHDPRRGPWVTRKIWVSVDPTSGLWRTTRVSHRGPQGHTEYRSWGDALLDVLADYPGVRLEDATRASMASSLDPSRAHR